MAQGGRAIGIDPASFMLQQQARASEMLQTLMNNMQRMWETEKNIKAQADEARRQRAVLEIDRLVSSTVTQSVREAAHLFEPALRAQFKEAGFSDAFIDATLPAWRDASISPEAFHRGVTMWSKGASEEDVLSMMMKSVAEGGTETRPTAPDQEEPARPTWIDQLVSQQREAAPQREVAPAAPTVPREEETVPAPKQKPDQFIFVPGRGFLPGDEALRATEQVPVTQSILFEPLTGMSDEEYRQKTEGWLGKRTEISPDIMAAKPHWEEVVEATSDRAGLVVGGTGLGPLDIAYAVIDRLPSAEARDAGLIDEAGKPVEAAVKGLAVEMTRRSSPENVEMVRERGWDAKFYGPTAETFRTDPTQVGRPRFSTIRIPPNDAGAVAEWAGIEKAPVPAVVEPPTQERLVSAATAARGEERANAKTVALAGKIVSDLNDAGAGDATAIRKLAPDYALWKKHLGVEAPEIDLMYARSVNSGLLEEYLARFYPSTERMQIEIAKIQAPAAFAQAAADYEAAVAKQMEAASDLEKKRLQAIVDDRKIAFDEAELEYRKEYLDKYLVPRLGTEAAQALVDGMKADLALQQFLADPTGEFKEQRETGIAMLQTIAKSLEDVKTDAAGNVAPAEIASYNRNADAARKLYMELFSGVTKDDAAALFPYVVEGSKPGFFPRVRELFGGPAAVGGLTFQPEYPEAEEKPKRRQAAPAAEVPIVPKEPTPDFKSMEDEFGVGL